MPVALAGILVPVAPAGILILVVVQRVSGEVALAVLAAVQLSLAIWLAAAAAALAFTVKDQTGQQVLAVGRAVAVAPAGVLAVDLAYLLVMPAVFMAAVAVVAATAAPAARGVPALFALSGLAAHVAHHHSRQLM